MAKRKKNKRTKVSAYIQDKGSVATNDGYNIPPANIGIPGYNLLSAGNYERSRLTGNQDLLTTLYRENWIVKRIVDTPAEDMTKKWYKLNSAITPEKIDQLRQAERKHSVQKEITDAIKWARLYGGSGALIVIKGQEDMLEHPLDLDMIMPGDFKGLLVIDRVTGLDPSLDIVEDLDDPDFGLPVHYTASLQGIANTQVRIHHSRLLRFTGRELPQQETEFEGYWGASEIEHIYSELQKRDAASANIGQLIFQANLKVQKMKDLGEILTTTSQKQRERILQGISLQNFLASSFGVHLLAAEDSYETHPYSFGGISEVYQQFKMDIAGAAEMPATKLFGQSPDGMNATGESDLINYNEAIAQKQENMLRAPLEKLLPVISMSLWGYVPDDLEIEFESIDTLTDDQKSTIASRDVTTITAAFNAGIIGEKTALMELKKTGQSLGRWDSITDEDLENADNEPQIPGEEEIPSGYLEAGQEPDADFFLSNKSDKATTQDAWNEGDHPRDKDGKFTSGGGGESKQEKRRSGNLSNYGKEKLSKVPKEMGTGSREIYERAVKHEGKITEEIRSITKDNKMELVGEEFRLKDPDSYWRKVQLKSKTLEISEELAANSLYDTVRYTAITSTNNLTNQTLKTFDGLRAKGYNLNMVSNTFTDPKATYKGINVKLLSPDGQKCELQFHTPESLKVKDKIHPLYEEYRKLRPDSKRAKELDKKMKKISATLKIPRDIEKVK